jgi:MOSC domain-containing protein YiiM
MPKVVSIAFKSKDMENKPANFFSRRSVERAVLAPDQGIVGDMKGGSGKRQLNVMFAETVAELRSEGSHALPGELGEQIVITGLPPGARAPGVQLQIGENAVISLDFYRTGCTRFEHIQQRPKKSVAGRLGIMARVLVGGEIAVGDQVVVLSTSNADISKQQTLFP